MLSQTLLSRLFSLLLISTVLSLPQRGIAGVVGVVKDTDGNAVPQALVVLGPDGMAVGDRRTAVFSDGTGAFRFPEQADGSRVQALKLGFATWQGEVSGEPLSITLTQASIADAPVPPSAWLPGDRADMGRADTVLQCASCHQFPSDKILRFGESVASLGEADRKTAWEAMITYMRVKFFEIGPDQSLYNPAQMDYQQITSPESGLFDAHDQAVISDYLAREFDPRRRAQVAEYRYGAPLGVTPRTVVEEIQLPQDSFVREIGLSHRSRYLWGADLQKNRLLRVDPQSGEQKAYPVPYDGPTGPHTIVDDADGYLWVTMIENGVLARFDPATEEWKLFDAFPSYEMAHDIAPNKNFQVAYDPRGRVWLSLIATNQLAWLDPDSGETATIPLPIDEGEPPIHRSVYGLVMTSDGGRVWFSQLSGGVGAVNTASGELEVFIDFPQGAGPRRIAIDDQDIIYVPLFGSGELFIYDSRADREIARVPLPDINSAVYSAVWDPWRRVVWLGTSNADVIYKYLPETRQFEVFPLPSVMAYLRMITFDRHTGNLWTAYSNIPTGAGPSRFVMLDPGDGVRPVQVAEEKSEH